MGLVLTKGMGNSSANETKTRRFKTMHSLYFLSYAIFATIVGLIALSAQYSRYKNEGVPFNATVLKVIGAFSLSMWTGAALTEYAYAASASAPSLFAATLA